MPKFHLNFNKLPKRSSPYVTRNARQASIHPHPRLPGGGLGERDGAVAWIAGGCSCRVIPLSRNSSTSAPQKN